MGQLHGGHGYIKAAMVLTAVMFLTLVPGAAYSEGGNMTLTLDECIKKAVEVNAEIKGAEFEVEAYKGKKEQADGARFPQVEVIAYGSLSPRARLVDGGRFGSPDSTTNINRESYDGVFGRATVQLIQPLYTFGKITGYRDAAAHGVSAYEAGAKLKASDVAMQVREAYNGLLLAREMKAFMLDIKDELDKATDKVSRQLDAGAPGVDQVDLFKLQTYQGELGKFIAQADEGVAKAYYGLGLMINCVGMNTDYDISEQYLTPAEVSLEEFNIYRDKAMGSRLEFTQLKEGLTAKEALIKATRADYFPQVFLLGFGSVAGATNRDHLNNPYIFDEFNHSMLGGVLGFKWSLDFGIHKGKVDEAKAEYMQLKMKEMYAKGGVPFQVKDAYLQLKRSTEEMQSLSKAYKTAKQWVVASLSNFDLGIGEARDIADSVSAYARIKSDYFRAVYNQRMALANLEHATGRDAEQLNYTSSPCVLDDLTNKEKQAGGM